MKVKTIDLCKWTAIPCSISSGEIKQSQLPPISFSKFSAKVLETFSKLYCTEKDFARIDLHLLITSWGKRPDLFHFRLKISLVILKGNVKSSKSFSFFYSWSYFFLYWSIVWLVSSSSFCLSPRAISSSTNKLSLYA